MNSLALSAYVVLVALLVLKYTLTIGLQGYRRHQSHLFRWAEDAAAFGGQVADSGEEPLVERAQHLLRNDGESQPYFLVAGATWLALGADGRWAWVAFVTYAASRWMHAAFLLRAVQPARTRAFGVGQVVMLLVVGDSIRRAVSGLIGFG